MRQNGLSIGTSAVIVIVLGLASCGQKEIPRNRPHLRDKAFDERVTGLLDFTVPVIGVGQLKDIQNEVLIFDARSPEEYRVSHIPGAQHLGYRDFDLKQLDSIPKDTKIVLYCSVGYRSELIGEELREAGYQKVYNLYGSIFEWVNRGYPVVNQRGDTTQKIHAYNRRWSQWVNHPEVEKIW